jgi:large subunit ribosomal protein L6
MFSLNLNIKDFSSSSTISLPRFNNFLRYSFVLLKNNGLLLSAVTKIKGFKKASVTRYFIYSRLLKFLPIKCERFFNGFDENKKVSVLYRFFSNSKSLTNLYNSTYGCFLSSSKIWFEELELVGLGYRLTIKNRSVRFRLGFSHVIILTIPLSVFVLKRKKRLIVYSTNKEQLSFFVSFLLRLKKMSAYKIKGIKKKNQIFNLKPGKKRAK